MNNSTKGIQVEEEVKLANIFPLPPSSGKIVDTLNALSSQKGKRKSLRLRFRRKKHHSVVHNHMWEEQACGWNWNSNQTSNHH